MGGGVVRASVCGVGDKARLRLGLVGGGVVGAWACDSVVRCRRGRSECGKCVVCCAVPEGAERVR